MPLMYLSIKTDTNYIGKTQANNREAGVQMSMKGFLMVNYSYVCLFCLLSPGKHLLRVKFHLFLVSA